MILNGQCLRLADNSVKYVNVSIDDIKNSINKPFMSEELGTLIEKSSNILYILSPDINEEVYEYFISLSKDKNFNIISSNIPEKYKSYEIVFDKYNYDDYEFFGAAAGRAAMLLHKKVREYDLVVVISSVILNAFGGYLGSIATLFTNTVAAKTMAQVIKYALQDIEHLGSYSKLASGTTIRNPIYESIREGIVTAGKAIHSFAVNIVSDYQYENEIKHNVFSGDVFISQIEAQNVITEYYNKLMPASLYDGIKLNAKCYNNVIYLISLIETACKRLMKGGRLLVHINDMKSFGNKTFQECFYKNTLEEIASSVDENNYMEAFYSFILKYYTLNYHIGITYNEELNANLIQAGLNPVKKEEYDEFLANCNNKAEY